MQFSLDFGMLQDATGLPIHALKRVNLYKDQQKSVKRVRMETDPAEIQRNRWNGCVFLGWDNRNVYLATFSFTSA